MSEKLNNGIYVSINPKPASKIVQGIKNYEFRNYIPKKSFNFNGLYFFYLFLYNNQSLMAKYYYLC